MVSGALVQFLGAFAVSMPSLLFGSLMAWPSYTLKVYADTARSPLGAPLSPLQQSLTGSLPPVGALLGTAVGPALIDRLGRRNGALLLGLPYLVAWCGVLVGSSGPLMLTARVLAGTSGGGAVVLAPVFISEVSEERLCGALASVPVWMYCLGLLVSYTLGWTLEYRAVAAAHVTLAVASLALMALMKETPVFLLKRNMEKAALASLAFYRGVPSAAATTDKDLLTELTSLRAQLHSPQELSRLPSATDLAAAEKAQEASATEECEPLRGGGGGDGDGGEGQPAKSVGANPALTGWQYLRSCGASRRALMVCALLVCAQSWMGSLAVQVYAGELFAEAAPGLSPDLCSVLLALVMMLGGLAASAVLGMLPRRALMIVSSLAVSLCLLTVGTQLQLHWGPVWLVPVLIFLFCFIFCLGPGTVPFVLLAELFVPEVQGVCTSLSITGLWLMNFALLGAFPSLQQALGGHGVFYAFASVASAAALFSIAYLPETRGISARQLQALLTPASPAPPASSIPATH